MEIIAVRKIQKGKGNTRFVFLPITWNKESKTVVILKNEDNDLIIKPGTPEKSKVKNDGGDEDFSQ